MVSRFLNLDDDTGSQDPDPKLGAGLKGRAKKPARAKVDVQAVAKAGEAHGFTRTTEKTTSPKPPRRGRPPLKQDMTYWRIYVAQELRDDLNQLRDEEGRRLNDLLVDMLAAYRASKG